MGFTPVKATRVVDIGLALLERDTMLAGTVWRDAAGDFAGAKDDTISIRLPAYAKANKRTLRANANRARRVLAERKVDVTLQSDLQIDVALTDEQLTLDVGDLARQVTAPAVGGIVRAYDEEIAAAMEGAAYEIDVTWDDTNPYDSLVDARVALDDANVPVDQRFLVVGSEFGAQLLKDDLLVRADKSGSTQTLRRGVIGEVASFTVLQSSGIAPDVGFAYHRTAFALATRAPVVPQGVAWGQSIASNGFALRVMQHLGQNGSGDLQNVCYHDAWVGVNTVEDNGTFDDNGKFEPSVDPSNSANDRFVRAVKLVAGS